MIVTLAPWLVCLLAGAGTFSVQSCCQCFGCDWRALVSSVRVLPVVFLLLVVFLRFLCFALVAALRASGASGASAGAGAVACADAGACGVVLVLGIMTRRAEVFSCKAFQLEES